MHILAVEDDFLTLTLLEASLHKMGYEVTTANNGKEAWELFQKKFFSLVLTDWIMPEMDGLELVRKIRSHHNNHYTYLILISGKSEKKEIVEGIEAGADDFITKPYEFDELRCRLNVAERILTLEAQLSRHNEFLQRSNERMRRELESAAKIQKAFLPKVHPKSPGVQFEWLFKPCEELAGDFLNIIPLDEKNIAFYILDVSGHGVSSALQSVMLSRVLSPTLDPFSILRQETKVAPGYRIVPPVEVAEELNKRFPWNDQTKQFFTLFYGILNWETLELRYITAGHPPPIVLSKNEPYTLPKEPSGPPISFLFDMPYEEYLLQLHPGDRLYLYSDGILEAMNLKREQFGRVRFIQYLTNNRIKSLHRTLEGLVEELEVWCEGKVLGDDVSLLALEVAELKSTQIFEN